MKLPHSLVTAIPLCSLFALAPCHASSPNQNARFLAGLPVSEEALEPITQKPFFVEHTKAFRDAWTNFGQRQTAPIHAWQKEVVPTATPVARPLVYFFSGPDILHAHAFFPDAPLYVLCGIEPIGTLPEMEKIDPAKLSSSLQQLRQSLESVLSWSFFKTKNMKTDLTATPLQGTLPILYLFLARMNCSVDAVEWVSVDKNGTLMPERMAGTLAPGVRIHFRREGSAGAQTLLYFSSDLSDGAVEKSGLLKWCASLGRTDAFLKSASYLLHSNGFQACRKFLLQNADRILQDDSGIPLKHFSENQWDLQPFGKYTAPIDLFKEHPQPDLVALYEKCRPAPLPFAFGYQWRPKQSGVLLATQKASKANENVPPPQKTVPPAP
jgi:hypothetical protein